MPSRLFLGYSLLVVTVAILLAAILVWRRRRQLDFERRNGRNRPWRRTEQDRRHGRNRLS